MARVCRSVSGSVSVSPLVLVWGFAAGVSAEVPESGEVLALD